MSVAQDKARAFGLLTSAFMVVALGCITHAGITSASRSVGGYGTGEPPTGSWSDVTSMTGGGYFDAHSPNAVQTSDIWPEDRLGPQVIIGNMSVDSQYWGEYDEQIWFGTTSLHINFTLYRQYDLLLSIGSILGQVVVLDGGGLSEMLFSSAGSWAVSLEPGSYSFDVSMDANVFSGGLSDLSLTIPAPATCVLLAGHLLAARRRRS